MKYILAPLLICICNIAFSQSQVQASLVSQSTAHLLFLERKWLIAEFALDTAFLSSLMDATFISVSDEGIHNKQQCLQSMYSNISQRLKDSIVIDSFNFENPVINIYDNTAVVIFTVHTHGKNKAMITDRKTRFYDVWIKRNNEWKAISSKGSTVEE